MSFHEQKAPDSFYVQKACSPRQHRHVQRTKLKDYSFLSPCIKRSFSTPPPPSSSSSISDHLHCIYIYLPTVTHASVPSQKTQPTMNHDNHLPTRSTPDPKPVKRRRTARYYVQRVRDSLTTRVSKLICATFLSLLAIIALIAFVLWISLRPHRPKIHIHGFSVSGLNRESGFEKARIEFNVTARNSNKNIGIYYKGMNGTVFYRDKSIGSTPLLFPFYQEPKNTTVADGVLKGAKLTVSSVRKKGNVAFRFDLTAVIRFKISIWESHNHRMHASCDVAVGPDGSILDAYRDKRCTVYFF